VASGTFPAEESSVIFLSIKESDLATNHVKECLGEGKGKEEENVSEWWCVQVGWLVRWLVLSAGRHSHHGIWLGQSLAQKLHKNYCMCQKHYWFDKIMQILLMHRLEHATTVITVLPELSFQ